MGTPKHGRCRRGVRPALGSIGRPPAGLNGERLAFWQAISQDIPRKDPLRLPGYPRRWEHAGSGMVVACPTSA